ncbi:MAG: cation-translocating P-type ATPase [Phycisphaerales bacterium]|nr:cation-translocating P-type ATPase [Phycisphaerales bacterium]
MTRSANAALRQDAESRYYLRITLIVTAGMIAGGLLHWPPLGPSPWRRLPLALVYLAGGHRIVIDGWRELRDHRRLSIDFLMAAAAAGTAAIGNPFEGGILIFLFSLSKTLEHYAMARTRSAVAKLMDLRPKLATLVDVDGRETGRVSVEQLEPGQAILVRPGERISADGVVRSGGSEVDQAAITGESVPVRKAPGDQVFAGTIAQGGSLVVEVTRRANETLLAKIVRLVEQAQEGRAPAQHFIDRFAHPYTIAVVVATVLTAVIPPVLFDVAWGDALYRAMTLLVVASPCALVIATPSAILSGIANGARHGILFKGGAYLDLAGSIDTIAFDKTGTLTLGRPRLVEVVGRQELRGKTALGGKPDNPAPSSDARAVLRIAAAVERTAEHHLARAVLDAARGQDLPPAEDFTAIPGEGVSGLVEGKRAWVGNQKMAQRMGAELGLQLPGWTAEHTAHGRSVVYVGTDDETLGAMAFGDTLKPNAAAAVRHLKYEGIRWITILSGDHPDAVRAIAAEVGADEVRAGLLPDEKVEAVRALAARSRGVAMVGDGVNDAPAMATATLGIAMGAAGTDVAIETADVVLMSDDVEKVDYVIHLGKRARRIVRQNTHFSVGWMLLLVVVTFTIGMPLTLAVVGHEGSTLLVALNGLRLLLARPHPQTAPA